jgi:predicted RNA-binding Zn-ribbon protein involved in translation (DUF1610 family)
MRSLTKQWELADQGFAVRCPKTGKEIPRPFPMGRGILIQAARFPCPACGKEHVLDYPPAQVK